RDDVDPVSHRRIARVTPRGREADVAAKLGSYGASPAAVAAFAVVRAASSTPLLQSAPIDGPARGVAPAGLLLWVSASPMWIVRLALRRPLSVAVFAILLLVLGMVSFTRMNVDIFPAINLPVVIVVWNYPGLSATDMERRVILISER